MANKLNSEISLAPLAYWCAFLPIFAVHASYLISALNAQVDWCFPYLDSCTSISNSARKHPAQVLFKPSMISTGVLMMAYWWLLVQWLRQLGERQNAVLRALLIMGVFAGLALILYSATLGTSELHLKGLRRTGIILFFGFTTLAHLLALYRLSKLGINSGDSLYRIQRSISYSLVLIGILNALLSLFYVRYREIDDAIEWCFALLMMLQFFLTGRMWQRNHFYIPLPTSENS